MKNGIHFISGLPRSGSTLLAGILAQNPHFSSGMSSPVAQLVTQMHLAMGAHHEYAVFLDERTRENIVRGIFQSYYADIQETRLIFDTNRAWCAKMSFIARLFPKAKVIACVRDFPWIIDSFERLVRENPLLFSRMFPQNAFANAHARTEHLVSSTGTVGFAWAALQDAFYGEHSNRLIVVDYEALTREPVRTMRLLYQHLGLRPFEHDFDNVSYDGGNEFDIRLGVPKLHTLKRKVSYQERKTVLPPEIFHRLSNRTFWKRVGANRDNVRMILCSEYARTEERSGAASCASE